MYSAVNRIASAMLKTEEGKEHILEPQEMLLGLVLYALQAAFSNTPDYIIVKDELSETLMFWLTIKSFDISKQIKFIRFNQSSSFNEYRYVFKMGHVDQLTIDLMISIKPNEFSKVVISSENNSASGLPIQKVIIYFADQDYGQITSGFFPLEALGLVAQSIGVIDVEGKPAYLYYTSL